MAAILYYYSLKFLHLRILQTELRVIKRQNEVRLYWM